MSDYSNKGLASNKKTLRNTGMAATRSSHHPQDWDRALWGEPPSFLSPGRNPDVLSSLAQRSRYGPTQVNGTCWKPALQGVKENCSWSGVSPEASTISHLVPWATGHLLMEKHLHYGPPIPTPAEPAPGTHRTWRPLSSLLCGLSSSLSWQSLTSGHQGKKCYVKSLAMFPWSREKVWTWNW